MEERINMAAIRFRLKNEKEYRIVTGKSHSDCILAFSDMYLPASQRDCDAEVQGFITDKNRFVDRFEALQIAKATKQVKDDYDYGVLYSEFIDLS